MAIQTIKAILLATSESNKLQPLTEIMPTPMVPVVNRPVMAYMIELLARQGIKNIVVSVYHMAGQIEAYFGNGRRWAVSLEYALQGQPLGSAGSLKWAQPLLPETFIVLPADSLLDLNISDALAHHRAAQCAATVIERRAVSPAVNEHISTPASESQAGFTGAYIFESQVLELIPARSAFDIQEQLLPAITEAGLAVSCFETAGFGNLLQSFGDYQEAQKTILTSLMGVGSDTAEIPELDEGDPPHKALSFLTVKGRPFVDGIWIGENQVIHPNARLTPPVYIGDNSYIGRDVELGPNTVIGSNVVIDDEATIAQSAILEGTYVGQLVNVENRLVNKNLIIDLETAGYMHVTDNFLLSQTYQAGINRGLMRVLDMLVALMLMIPAAILSLPLALLLWLTTGKVFNSLQCQINRPMTTGEPQKETFYLLQFNAKGNRNGYNWIGRWLTRLEIHRWPELWNLLKGDLQLIGVKPLSPEEIGRLNEQWQQPRHERRPGLTGLWYINSRQNSNLDEFVVADIYYIATQNQREDLKILSQTPVSWFRRIRR